MPHVAVRCGSHGNPVYEVGGRSFVVFRNPRPDAVNPATGERYDDVDVIVIWVASEVEKQALARRTTSSALSSGWRSSSARQAPPATTALWSHASSLLGGRESCRRVA